MGKGPLEIGNVQWERTSNYMPWEWEMGKCNVLQEIWSCAAKQQGDDIRAGGSDGGRVTKENISTTTSITLFRIIISVINIILKPL